MPAARPARNIFRRILKTPLDVVGWLRRIADNLEAENVPDAEPAVIPFGYPQPCLWPHLGRAANVLRAAVTKGLINGGLPKGFSFTIDPPLFKEFCDTVYDTAVASAQEQGTEEPPPAGPADAKERMAWALRTVADGIWRAGCRRLQEAVAAAADPEARERIAHAEAVAKFRLEDRSGKIQFKTMERLRQVFPESLLRWEKNGNVWAYDREDLEVVLKVVDLHSNSKTDWRDGLTSCRKLTVQQIEQETQQFRQHLRESRGE